MQAAAVNKFVQFLKKSISPSPTDLNELVSLLSYHEVLKNEKLIPSGRVCRKIYFLADGYVKYQLNQDNQKKVVHIAGDGVFVSNFGSYFSGQNAITDIYTITASKLLSISKEDLEKLYNTNLVWANFGRKIAENAVTHQIMERINIQTLSAEERYHKIIQSNPELFKVIKLGDLAEILGITQETLSRIRRRLK